MNSQVVVSGFPSRPEKKGRLIAGYFLCVMLNLELTELTFHTCALNKILHIFRVTQEFNHILHVLLQFYVLSLSRSIAET